MENCLFCKIINKEIPAKFVYQDEDIAVIWDIKPKARVHLLVLPAVHVNSFLDLQDNQIPLLTKMAKVVQRLIKEQNLTGSYHLIINGGARQEINHFHWHILSD